MMPKVLIISPYFAPTNAADMQRIRMSLPYFKDLGWEAEIVTVDLRYSDLIEDDILTQSISENTIIHVVNAFNKRWTRKIGLGSIALRSLWFYRKRVNRLLSKDKFQLILFSTTQFPVCILGAYWKRKFGIPYVIDMQDPWHSDYYLNKPKNQRPPKYWFSYRLNKWLEPIAMKTVDGLISVSQEYINDLKKRYPAIKAIPETVITFGAFERDFRIAEKNLNKIKSFVNSENGKINLVYIGRGGLDMQLSVRLLLLAIRKGISIHPDAFKKFHLHFIGTSYASTGYGIKTVEPVGKEMGLNAQVTESTDRIGYYESIATLQNADILFLPGSDDPKYTASKIFPYLLCKKPLLAIFHEKSSTVKIIRTCSPDAYLLTFPGDSEKMVNQIYDQLLKWSSGDIKTLNLNIKALKEYSAEAMTGKQIALFERVILNR